MATAASYAEEVRSLKAQRAPRVMVRAAVETYGILLQKEAAAENLRALKARGASPDEVREANNALKLLKELDAAREKVALLKESRATPSEVAEAVAQYVALKEKTRDPVPPSFPPSPDHRPAISIIAEAKMPTAPLPPLASSFSSPLSPIPEDRPLRAPRRNLLYGLRASILVGAGVGGLIALLWKRVDEAYLMKTITGALQATADPGRMAEMQGAGQTVLVKTKAILHLLPATILCLSTWFSFQLAQRLSVQLGAPRGRRGWAITAPCVLLGLSAGCVLTGYATSFALYRVAAGLGLSLLRTLIMGARIKDKA